MPWKIISTSDSKRFVGVSCRCGSLFDLANLQSQLEKLEARSEAPDLWDQPDDAKSVFEQIKQVRVLTDPASRIQSLIDEVEVALELSPEDDSLIQEAVALVALLEKELVSFETLALFDGEYDNYPCYLRIQAGTGGLEAQDWARMLRRMYLRYCERNAFEVETVDEDYNEGDLLRSCELLVSGPFAHGLLKNEAGVHRLIRLSPFSSNNTRHTSFAAVEITPDFGKLLDLDIDWTKDVRVDRMRAGGPGGQHQNTTESAVRLTHVPTGIVVCCRNGRSQHQNLDRAREMLMAKLLQHQRLQRDEELKGLYNDKGQIAWGSQIRTYVLDDKRVKDHRTNVESRHPDNVLDGDLEAFIEAKLRLRRI